MQRSRFKISGNGGFRRIIGSARGSVLTEMVVVLPLCLLFMIGMLEVGRLLAQYSWVQQTTYNAAILGSGLTTTDVVASPEVVANSLFNKLNQAKGNMSQPKIRAAYRPGHNPGIDDTVSVNVRSNLNLISNFYPLSINNTTTSPSASFAYTVTDINSFDNGIAGQFYNCSGTLCSTPGPCAPAVCP